MGVDLPAHFNDFIAKAYADNIRELEGALHKVALYHSMRELSLEEVAKILGKDKKTKRSRVNIAKVIREVSKEFNITAKELKGPRRTAEIAFARQVCMYLLREDFDFKLEDVAKQLERKDHTTVMHAVDKIKSKMLVDEGFKNQIDLIRDNISLHLEQ
jgi:chromosomal replication initiator protein